MVEQAKKRDHIKPLDEQPKGRKGIKEMLDRMFENDNDGQQFCISLS